MRLCWVLLVLGSVILADVTCGLLALLPQPGITKANFFRIRRGMSLEEIQRVLGAAPGDYQTDHYGGTVIGHLDMAELPAEGQVPKELRQWLAGAPSDMVSISVSLDEHGKVVAASYFRQFIRSESFLDRLRRLLR